MNSMKELYRAVVNRRPILAVLEPDPTQDGGLDRKAIVALLTDAHVDKFNLRKKWASWKSEGEVAVSGFDHPPDGAEVAAALFAVNPIEWNRLPHFQDVRESQTSESPTHASLCGSTALHVARRELSPSLPCRYASCPRR